MNKDTGSTPSQRKPGEVERDNDALRPDPKAPDDQKTTAQRTAKNQGTTEGGGKLSAEWRALFERYPDRFLIGSDTWVNQRWESYGEIMAGYRAWLGQLPPKTAAQIAHGNARALFGEDR